MAKKETVQQGEQVENITKYFSTVDGTEVTPTENQKILQIIAKEIEHENKKFFGYHVVAKNGDLTQLKFTRTAKNKPETNGTHFILVDLEEVNLDTWTKVKPVMWVKNVLDIVQPDNSAKTSKKKQAFDNF